MKTFIEIGTAGAILFVFIVGFMLIGTALEELAGALWVTFAVCFVAAILFVTAGEVYKKAFMAGWDSNSELPEEESE